MRDILSASRSCDEIISVDVNHDMYSVPRTHGMYAKKRHLSFLTNARVKIIAIYVKNQKHCIEVMYSLLIFALTYSTRKIYFS